MIKIASWNVNSLRKRLPHVLDWLKANNPTALVLQETKVENADFPAQAIEDAGYSVVFSGEKSYNGVAIISRSPAQQVMTESDLQHLEKPLDDKRMITATVDDVRIINLYVVNGSEVDSDKYQYKMHWLDTITAFLEEQVQLHKHCVVLGDFNIAPYDRDVYSPEAFKNEILCSNLERMKLQNILNVGLIDTFRLFERDDAKYTKYSWWDYRNGSFKKDHGCRIDLILASSALTEHCVESTIDVTPRELESPSDHAPVVARFAV